MNLKRVALQSHGMMLKLINLILKNVIRQVGESVREIDSPTARSTRQSAVGDSCQKPWYRVGKKRRNPRKTL